MVKLARWILGSLMFVNLTAYGGDNHPDTTGYPGQGQSPGTTGGSTGGGNQIGAPTGGGTGVGGIHVPNANSYVSPRAKGNSPTEAWNNTVNKKFAACLNGFGTTATGEKFDCLDNSVVNYQNFDQLWASTDSSSDGGLPNAIVLANNQKQIITGFYRMNGQRCDQFSEFAGPLKPAIVNPKSQGIVYTTPDIEYVGDPIKTPGTFSGATGGYDFMKDKFTDQGKSVPSDADSMRNCPILVRAAAVYTCPSDTNTTMNPGGVQPQCAVADDVKIHLRVEQLYQIRGQIKFATYDTVANNNGASSVSIRRIIADKYGMSCPPRMMHDPATGECVPNPEP